MVRVGDTWTAGAATWLKEWEEEDDSDPSSRSESGLDIGYVIVEMYESGNEVGGVGMASNVSTLSCSRSSGRARKSWRSRVSSVGRG